MKPRKKYHIWTQRGDTAEYIREGSVRLGRTLRAARALDLLTQDRVFVQRSLSDTLEPDPQSPRFHARAKHPSLSQSPR